MTSTLDLLDDLMEDEDICDAEAPEDEEESEEEDIHVCGFCKEQFTDLDKFVKHKKSKICRKSPSKDKSSATPNRKAAAVKPKRAFSPSKPKLIRLNVRKSPSKAKGSKPKESATTKEKENLVTITRSGRKATSWKTVKLEPESEPDYDPDEDIYGDIQEDDDDQDDYVGPKGGDPADSETEVERPQRRKRGRPPGKGRGVGVRKKGPGTGTKKPLHKSKLIEQNLKVISHEEYEKALRKYSSNVIVETEDGTRHKIADKQEEDLLVANAGNAEKLPEQDPTSDSVQGSSEQQLEEEVDQPAGEIDNAEAEEPEPDTTVEVITETADGVVKSQVFSASTAKPTGPAIVHKKVANTATEAQFVTKVITTGQGPNGEIQTKVVQKQVYPCTVEGCSFRGSYAKDLKRHLRIHTGEKPYKCRICAKPFARVDKVRLHEKLHTGDKPFKCEECDYATVEKGSLKKHMRKHTDERPFKCQVCPYRAKDSSQLTIHLRTHTGDCPYICWFKNCSASFKTNSDLKRHTRTHTGERPFACTHCTYRCSIKANLKNHIMVNHPNEAEEFHKCKVCDYTNRVKLQVLRHEKKHSKVLFICDLCEYNSKTKSQFLIHRRKRHGIGAKVLECELCDYTSTWEGGISSHMNKKHGGVGAKISEDASDSKTGTASSSPSKRVLPKRGTKRIKKDSKVDDDGNDDEEHEEELDDEAGAGTDLDHDDEGEETTGQRKKAWLNKSNCIPNFVCPFCDAGFVRHDSYQSHLGQHKKQVIDNSSTDADKPVVSNNLDVATVPDLPEPPVRLPRPKVPGKAKVERQPRPPRKPKVLTKKQQKLLERQQQFAAQQQLRLEQQRVTTIVINPEQNSRLNTTNSTEVVLPLMPMTPSAPSKPDPARPQQPSFFTPLKLEPPSGQVLTATAVPSTTMNPALLPAPPPPPKPQPQIVQTQLAQQVHTEGGVQYVITPVNAADQTLIQNVNEVHQVQQVQQVQQIHQVQAPPQQHQTTTVVMQGGIVPTFTTR